MAKQKNNISETTEDKKTLPFTKMNYILVLVGVALIALGMILMIGGGSSDPDVFNPKMFNFQRITLAPILILLGFVMEIVAIFWKKKK
ncbi:MAG: DUF3098 domain-containing protein [Bacteroidales bacterium]|nr:DUF3098 domain-containing protein [Bacteroidales bacterium]